MKKNPFLQLLDENNNENIIFTNDLGEKVEFEQVALINLEDEKYAILHPVNLGFADDEVIIYSIYSDDNNYELNEVTDDNLKEEIYSEYRRIYNKR
jgi:hypothetical protein